MTIARHHAEWLSLLEISGPFLSLPVLLRAFPQGLDAPDTDLTANLRLAYEEWSDNQKGLRPDAAIHRVWVEWVLRNLLDMPDEVILGSRLAGDAPSADEVSDLTVELPEYRETLRPDYAIVEPRPDGSPPAARSARLLIQIVQPGQALEKPLGARSWVASPAMRLMTLLHGTGVRLGLVTNGEQWMLVDAPLGGTTGYISWFSDLWLDEPLTLRAFGSLLRARRFFGVPPDETIEALLAASANEQQEVTDQLGEQVRRAVEVVVRAIDQVDQDRGRTLLASVGDEQLYEAAVTLMMRLVFLFCAEERDLLLLGDPLYDEFYAVSTLRVQLREAADHLGEDVLERRCDAWCRLLATFRAVHGGIRHDRLNLPAYGGSLFDPDRYSFLEGRPIGSSWQLTVASPLTIDNRTVLHLLESLQILQVRVPGGGPTEARRLSFRALDVEQIGHVYEGLLDHTVGRASEPLVGLTSPKDRQYVVSLVTLETERAKGEDALVTFLKEQTGRSPSALHNACRAGLNLDLAQQLRLACDNDDALYERVAPFAALIRADSYGNPVVVPSGSVYLASGQERRATGTHYTPRSLTEPIVEHTLEPQVYLGPSEGLPRDQWKLRSAAELLDLKVCDMAMGSGAFLVQADRYLSERLVEAWEVGEKSTERKPVTAEGLVADDLNEAIPSDVAERLVLARRLVAERCLFGVDKNHLAVGW